MAKHRDRLEIIVAILNVACKGARKTRIMGFANLSYKLLQKYLPETIQLGFVSFGNGLYEVTEKGHAFLEKYNDFSSRYSKVDSEFRKMIFEKESLEKLCEPSLGPNLKLQRRRQRR